MKKILAFAAAMFTGQFAYSQNCPVVISTGNGAANVFNGNKLLGQFRMNTIPGATCNPTDEKPGTIEMSYKLPPGEVVQVGTDIKVFSNAVTLFKTCNVASEIENSNGIKQERYTEEDGTMVYKATGDICVKDDAKGTIILDKDGNAVLGSVVDPKDGACTNGRVLAFQNNNFEEVTEKGKTIRIENAAGGVLAEGIGVTNVIATSSLPTAMEFGPGTTMSAGQGRKDVCWVSYKLQ